MMALARAHLWCSRLRSLDYFTCTSAISHLVTEIFYFHIIEVSQFDLNKERSTLFPLL